MGKASLLARFIALLIDSIIVGIVSGIVGTVVGDQVLGVGTGFIVGALYQGYFLPSNNGQTPGKVLLGIRVVKTNGASITFLEAIVRYIGYYINSILLMIGWLWAIFDGNNQGFHDKIAGTYVVRA